MSLGKDVWGAGCLNGYLSKTWLRKTFGRFYVRTSGGIYLN
jgi:hypothetical protein